MNHVCSFKDCPHSKKASLELTPDMLDKGVTFMWVPSLWMRIKFLFGGDLKMGISKNKSGGMAISFLDVEI